MLVLALFSKPEEAARTLSCAQRVITAAAEVGITVSAVVTNISTLARPGADVALLGYKVPKLRYFDLDVAPTNTVALQVELCATHAVGVVVVRGGTYAAHPVVTAVVNACASKDRTLLVAKPADFFNV